MLISQIQQLVIIDMQTLNNNYSNEVYYLFCSSLLNYAGLQYYIENIEFIAVLMNSHNSFIIVSKQMGR